MAANIFGRYVWLVDTLMRHKKLTYKEINDLWKQSHLSYGVNDELPLRTFHNHCVAIKDIFGVFINCDTRDGYRYYIDHPDDITDNKLRDWLVSSYSMLNQIQADRTLQGRIIFEDIPSGQRWLTIITEAMRTNKVLRITYKGFEHDKEMTFDVEPYWLKVFSRRWYLTARSPYLSEKDGKDTYRTYALDRIYDVEKTERNFEMKGDFDAEKFFADYYGVTVTDGPVERVLIKAIELQPEYLRTLPLHPSQRELESDDDYTIFEYHLKPNFEFYQLLLSQTDLIEVLEPESLRQKMKVFAEHLMGYYGKG